MNIARAPRWIWSVLLIAIAAHCTAGDRAQDSIAQGRLAEALALIEHDLANDADIDLAFKIGQRARELGQAALAVRAFRAILTVRPELHRVRLELAAALAEGGDRKAAQREFLRVRAAQPPPAVRTRIDAGTVQQAVNGRREL